MGSSLDLRAPAADHDESFEELAAALALGCIEADDAERLRPHLATCARCRQLVAEYRVVVGSLPLSVPEAPADPALKSRLLAAASERGRVGEWESGRRGISPTLPLPHSPTLRRRRVPVAWVLPLVAMLLVTVGMGWWNLLLQQQMLMQQAQLRQQDRFIEAVAAGGQVVRLAGTDRAPSARGEVVQPVGGGPPLLAVHGLPELPTDRVYQVWVIAGGQPASAGLFRPGGESPPIVPLERGLGGVQAVALTVEPRGGSPGPTTPIVLVGNV